MAEKRLVYINLEVGNCTKSKYFVQIYKFSVSVD